MDRSRRISVAYIPLICCIARLMPTAAQGTCTVIFSLDPGQSTAALGGSVVEPVVSALSNANPGVSIGFQGEMAAQLPAPCPSTAPALATALVGTQLVTTSITGPLLFYPSEVTLKNGLVTLQWENVTFNGALSLNGSQSSLQLAVAQGSVNSTSLLTPNGTLLNLSGVNGTSSTTAQVSTNGSEVTVAVAPTFLTLPSVYTSTLNNAPLIGVTNYTLNTTLYLKTTVGCSVDCGVNGRCMPTQGGEVACQCECGWGGTACDVPSGYCPRYSEGFTTQSCPQQSGTLSPSASNSSAAGVCAAQCSAWETWNSTSGSCECLAGWGGVGCDACQTDAACTSFYSSVTGEKVVGTCDASYLYSHDTVYKAYSCDLTGSGLEKIIQPGSFFVGCNTTTSAVAPVQSSNALAEATIAEGSYCQVEFALQDHPTNPLICKASLCAFHANQSAVNCQSTSCTCQTACPYLDGVFQQIKGHPAVIDCDSAGHCSFFIENFFVQPTANCSNHNCHVQGYVLEEGAYTYTPDRNYNAVIAAVPMMILVVCAAWLSAHLIRERRFFRSVPASGAETNPDTSAHLAPVTAVHELTFMDVSSTISLSRGASRAILSRVSGSARVGELMGILGPSGGGKTSLLSVLSGRSMDLGRGVRVSGMITLDGVPVDKPAAARRIAYCAQDALLLPTLTVEETVRYSALLRLPPHTSAPEVSEVVERAIEELGLGQVVGSMIGGNSWLRGISGGEHRRVTIAMELVINPSVLILDEPTSGLDSFTALQIMTTLKRLAVSGRIVLLSFHQPSPAMFSLLDNVFLLAQGKCVFSGSPHAVEPHFARLGLPCPPNVGVAEHMLHATCDPETLPILLEYVETEDVAVNKSALAEQASFVSTTEQDSSEDAEAGVQIAANTGQEVPQKAGVPQRKAFSEATTVLHPRKSTLSRELAVLFWRALIDILRNPALLVLHWAIAIGIGIFVGLIFLNVDLTISGAQDRLGGAFFSLAFFAFTSLTTTDLLLAERRIVAREVRGGYYSAESYLVSKAVVDALLLRAMPVFLYSASFYPLMHLQSGATHVTLFLFTLATFGVTVGALSLAVAVSVRTSGQASLVMNLLLLLGLLVGGFFVNVGAIPAWIGWLRYISPFFYGYSVLVINELSTLLFDFTVAGYTAVQNVRGTTFLNIIGINPKDLTNNIIILDCMWVAFLLLAFGLQAWRMRRAVRSPVASSGRAEGNNIGPWALMRHILNALS